MYSYSFNVRKWIDKSLVYCLGTILLFCVFIWFILLFFLSASNFLKVSYSLYYIKNLAFYSLNVWKWIDKLLIYWDFFTIFIWFYCFSCSLQLPESVVWQCQSLRRCGNHGCQPKFDRRRPKKSSNSYRKCQK